jgi:hypothetical protein
LVVKQGPQQLLALLLLALLLLLLLLALLLLLLLLLLAGAGWRLQVLQQPVSTMGGRECAAC